MSLAWDRSSDRWSFGYEVLVDGQKVATAAHPYMGTPAITLRKIRPGRHVFQVRARDTAGNVSGLSNEVAVELTGNGDATPPSAPTDLTVEDFNDNCGSLILRWTPSTDNVDDQSQIEYELHRDGVFTQQLTQPGASWIGIYTVAGTQTWTVVAVDRAGNSSPPSNAVTLTVVTDPDLC